MEWRITFISSVLVVGLSLTLVTPALAQVATEEEAAKELEALLDELEKGDSDSAMDEGETGTMVVQPNPWG